MKWNHLIFRFLVIAVLVCWDSPDSQANVVFGKVIEVQGDAFLKNQRGEQPVAVGLVLREGDSLRTEKNGLVRLLFEQKYSIRLAESSQVQIKKTQGEKGQPGFVEVLDGRVRFSFDKLAPEAKPDAKLAKGYKESSDLNADLSLEDIMNLKLVVKTKGAAVGVGGTDLEVIYNAKTNLTSTLTYEGVVNEVELDPSELEKDVTELRDQFRSSQTLKIPPGMVGTLNKSVEPQIFPTKISPEQFEILKTGSVARVERKKSNAESMLPPALDALKFNSEAQLKQTLLEVGFEPNEKYFKPPVNEKGFFDDSAGSKGKYAPPTGGYMDLRSGLYIAPPPGSAFDANTGDFLVQANLGTLDAQGQFVPPSGYRLDAEKGFIKTLKTGAELEKEQGVLVAEVASDAGSAGGSGGSPIPDGFNGISQLSSTGEDMLKLRDGPFPLNVTNKGKSMEEDEEVAIALNAILNAANEATNNPLIINVLRTGLFFSILVQ